MNEEFKSRLLARFEIGKRRYGHGMHVKSGLDWEREMMEEIFDAVVYAAARVLSQRDDTDDRIDEDDNDAIIKLINDRFSSKEIAHDEATHILDLVLFIAKYLVDPPSEPVQLPSVIDQSPDPKK
jgi:hypothetical protein